MTRRCAKDIPTPEINIDCFEDIRNKSKPLLHQFPEYIAKALL